MGRRDEAGSVGPGCVSQPEADTGWVDSQTATKGVRLGMELEASLRGYRDDRLMARK